MIFQQTGAAGIAAPRTPLLRLWPFWLVLVVFEATLWLLLAMKFRQPCAVVALAVGLAMGVAIQISGGRGLRGAAWALALTLLTYALALYAQAALHVARVLGLDPLSALAGTGMEFARAVLPGLLSTSDLSLLLGGLVLALLFGFTPRWNRGPGLEPDRPAASKPPPAGGGDQDLD